MVKVVTTTVTDEQILAKADKLGISRARALEHGLKALIEEKEGFATIEKLQKAIDRINDELRIRNERIAELEAELGKARNTYKDEVE